MSNIPALGLHNNENLTRIFIIIKTITDPRRTFLHPFESILMIMICAMICGANNDVSIAQFGKNHIDWFKKFIDLPFGIPTHDTFNRMLRRIHLKEIKNLLQIVKQNLVTNVANSDENNDIVQALKKHISIDAKVLRALTSINPLSLVRAYSTDKKCILIQQRVDAQTNEITTIPKVLDQIKEHVDGAIITIDAIGTQTNIVKKITELKGDYLLPVKGNQHQTYADLKLFLDDLMQDKTSDITHTYHETIDKGHGRIEKRKCWTTDDVNWLYRRKRWKNLTSISVIETTITKDEHVTITRKYYISSLSSHAKIILAIARNHWGIENELHWLLNVAFREHISTTRKCMGAENIAILRCLALALLQNNSSTLSINNKRSHAAHSFEYLLEVLLGEKIEFKTINTYPQKVAHFVDDMINKIINLACNIGLFGA